MSDLTHILSQIECGDPSAAEQLLPLVYDELRKLAAAKLAQEKPGQTLQSTALVHEVYLRLIGNKTKESWDSRGHFFAAAAEAMRRILVEVARHKKCQKAGGDRERIEFARVDPIGKSPSVDVLGLNDALDKLEIKDARKAALVKLRYFSGLTNAQAAAALKISIATAENDWVYAKNWLRVEIATQRDA